MPRVNDVYGFPSDARTFQSTDALVLPTCYVGVEVELERVNGTQLTGLWLTKTDGSLRNDGLEYAFAQPTMGHDVVTALRQLESAFSNHEGPLVTNNTSVHVHVDIRDMEFEQLFKFVLLYLMYEQVLFNYCAPDRENNIFCISLERAQGDIPRYAHILESIRRGRFHDVPSTTGRFDRYGGINLAAMGRFGSVEFRGHRGEWRAEPLLNWINILMSLKAAALDNSINWERPYLALKEEGSIEFTRRVFGQYADLLLNPSFEEQLHTGLQLARRIVNYTASFSLNRLGARQGNELRDKIRGKRRSRIQIPRELLANMAARKHEVARELYRQAHQRMHVSDLRRFCRSHYQVAERAIGLTAMQTRTAYVNAIVHGEDHALRYIASLNEVQTNPDEVLLAVPTTEWPTQLTTTTDQG